VCEQFGVTFGNNSIFTFVNNIAEYDGGVLYFDDCANFLITGNSLVTVANNSAGRNGGNYFEANEFLTFSGNSTTLFDNNEAENEVAIYNGRNS